MSALQVRPMTEAEYTHYLQQKIEGDAQDRAKAEGGDLTTARRAIEREINGLLINRFHTPGHFFWNVLVEGSSESIGAVWFQDYADPQEGIHEGHLWGIDIVPAFRRRGHATTILKRIEAAAIELGCSTLRLHVFPHNEAANALYRKTGFRATNVFMAKPLAEKKKSSTPRSSE